MAAFFLLMAVALVTESERWSLLVMGACNVSYSFAWYLLIRLPQVRADAASPTPVWSERIVSIIAVEIAVIALSLGLTFYLQSRKTDFI
jgi:predicted cation transporter